LREPSLLGGSAGLAGQRFSVPLLGRVFDTLLTRYRQGLEVSLAVLEELTPEEMSHIAGICQRQQGPVNETAFKDCIKIIEGESQAQNISNDDDLLAFRNKLKESKGTQK
jgi:hypothetical protein